MVRDSSRRLMLVFLACLSFVVLSLHTPTVHAEINDRVAVHLTSIDPYTISNDGTIKLSGTITNTSDEPITNLTVQLWRDATPLTSPFMVDEAIRHPHSGGASMHSGDAVHVFSDPLAPGQTRDFDVSASLRGDAAELLYFSIPNAAYQVGVEVLGTLSDQGYSLIGEANSFVVYPGDD